MSEKSSAWPVRNTFGMPDAPSGFSFLRQRPLGRVGVGVSQAEDRPVLVYDLDRAPIGERRHGQLRDELQSGLVVE